MSFHNTVPCFLTFYRSNQSLLPFKFKIFVLNTSLFTFYAILFMLYFVVDMIMHGYNTVEHSTTGANNCTGTNYCKVLI